MKKFLSLLTLLLCAVVSVNASNAISCSAFRSATAGSPTLTNCSMAFYSDEGKTGSAPTTTKITVSEIDYYYAKVNDNKNYFELTLDQTVSGTKYKKFEAGDVIRVYLYTNDASPSCLIGKTTKTNVGLSGQATKTIVYVEHTMSADEIESDGTIRIYRNSSKTYFAGVSVSGTRATEKFTVTFDVGSAGTCGTASLTEASPGVGVTLPAVTPNSGYAFNGWYTAASAGTKLGDAGDTYIPTANITAYAQYSEELAPGISIDNYSPSTVRGAAITFTATATGAPAPTVTWYQSGTATTSGGTSKGTGTTYKPDVATPGTYYYYAVAANGVSPDATSSLITLTVTNPDVDRTGYNTYYVEENETTVNGAKVLCDDITMEFVSGGTFNTAVDDRTIESVNSNFVASITSGSNGWGVTFTPAIDGKLSVGVVINGEKTFSITNVTSFAYNGKDVDSDDSQGTNDSGSWAPAKKQYTIITIDVKSGTSYKFSVAGSKMGFYGFEFTPMVTAAVNSTYGWATFCSDKALDFTGITDVKAYIVTDHNKKAIEKTQVTGAVKANTPLLLEGATTEIPVATTTGTDYSGTNKLHAGNGTTDGVAWESGKTKYVLGVNTSTNEAEFQKIVDGIPATVPAGKAYLQFDEEITDAPFLSLFFEDEMVTGVNDVRSKMAEVNGEVYNLNGQRVSKPAKGLYIVNGKKVVIK